MAEELTLDQRPGNRGAVQLYKRPPVSCTLAFALGGFTAPRSRRPRASRRDTSSDRQQPCEGLCRRRPKGGGASPRRQGHFAEILLRRRITLAARLAALGHDLDKLVGSLDGPGPRRTASEVDGVDRLGRQRSAVGRPSNGRRRGVARRARGKACRIPRPRGERRRISAVRAQLHTAWGGPER